MIQLDALPMDGKLIVRVPLERDGDRGGRRDAPSSGGGGFDDDNILF
jgi:hypothetical protein